MWYEIFLRQKDPGPASAVALREGLGAEPGLEPVGGGWRARLEGGEAEVALHPAAPEAFEAATARGVDLRVPGGANPALAAAACALAFRWAGRYGLTVYDPQLGREVTARDAEGMQARMARLADYLTDTVGIDDGAQARHIAVDPPRRGLSPRAKFYLGLAVLLALLALLARYC